MMRYTVIGLGQFGQELCTELSARNIEVVAVASPIRQYDEESISTSEKVLICSSMLKVKRPFIDHKPVIIL